VKTQSASNKERNGQTWFAACLAKNLYSRGVKELVGNKLSAGSAILLSITESDDEE
jgi:hypothetical protein